MFCAVLTCLGGLPGCEAWSASASPCMFWSVGPSVHYATISMTHKVKAISAQRMRKWMEAEMRPRSRRDTRTS